MSLAQFMGAAVLAATVASPAWAAGPYAPGDMGVVTTASFGNTVSGVFSDNYTFSVLSDSVAGTSVTNITFDIGDQVVNQIVDLSATLAGQSLDFSSVAVPTGGESTMGYLKILLEPGQYQLTVSGRVENSAQASYAGNIAVAVVPEPETYALMLAGLGAVGFLARRRRMS